MQNLFWAFFYNIVLIPLAAFGFLIPMVAAGAMAFSSIFVVTNSLRLRGYDVHKVAAPKSLARQLVELTPRLVAPAGALALLIALSVGWLMPAQANAGMAKSLPGRNTNAYRVFIDQTTPFMVGKPTTLKMEILDQFGKRLTDFEVSAFGRSATYAYFAVAPRDLTSLQAAPLFLKPLGSGTTGSGMGMGAAPASAQPASPKPTVPPPSFDSRAARPTVVFPTEGQYVAFVEFRPLGGQPVTLAAPIDVGSAETPAAVLAPDPSATQTIAGLQITLKTRGPLVAGQDSAVYFEAIDEAGEVRTGEIEMESGAFLHLYIVDEQVTTFLRPEFANRNNLEFAVKFPKPGEYKAWFEFRYAGKLQQIPFVVDVEKDAMRSSEHPSTPKP